MEIIEYQIPSGKVYKTEKIPTFDEYLKGIVIKWEDIILPEYSEPVWENEKTKILRVNILYSLRELLWYSRIQLKILKGKERLEGVGVIALDDLGKVDLVDFMGVDDYSVYCIFDRVGSEWVARCSPFRSLEEAIKEAKRES